MEPIEWMTRTLAELQASAARNANAVADLLRQRAEEREHGKSADPALLHRCAALKMEALLIRQQYFWIQLRLTGFQIEAHLKVFPPSSGVPDFMPDRLD